MEGHLTLFSTTFFIKWTPYDHSNQKRKSKTFSISAKNFLRTINSVITFSLSK